jgi:hypothetical protein
MYHHEIIAVCPNSVTQSTAIKRHLLQIGRGGCDKICCHSSSPWVIILVFDKTENNNRTWAETNNHD